MERVVDHILVAHDRPQLIIHGCWVREVVDVMNGWGKDSRMDTGGNVR